MKLRHAILIVGLTLLTRLVPLPTIAPTSAPFEPLLHAQQTGYQNWAFIHTVKVPADYTDLTAATALQSIPALVMTFPSSTAATYQVDCDLFYSQATVVADGFGMGFLGNSPTNSEFGGFAFTNATAVAAGTPANITNLTATAVVTMTPAVTTVLYAHMGGTAEIASNATDTTLTAQVSQSTAANAIVIKRGSVCRWAAMP